MNRHPATAFVAAAMLLMLGACTPDPVETPSPEPTLSSAPASTAEATPTPTPTPAPTPSPSPEQTLNPEQEAALTAVKEYFEALNELRSDPDADFQRMAGLSGKRCKWLHRP